MNLTRLEFSRDGGVAEIVLDRPEAANALDLRMAADLAAVASRCASDPAVRAVVLTARGKMFCAGGDVTSFAAAGEGVGELMRQMTAQFHGAIARFERMDAPLVVALNGTVAGAGLGLMLMGDVVVAAEGAKLTLAYTGIGLSPDGGCSHFLPRSVGLLRAKQMMLMNPRLTAAEALTAGLVTEVVPDDQVLARARAIARQLAAGPTQAHGVVKRLLADTFSTPLETQMECEARGIAGLAGGTLDAREGIAAFVAKRTPNFRGQ